MQIHKLLKLLFLLVLVILIGRIVIGKEQQKGLEEIEEIPLEDTSGFIVSGSFIMVESPPVYIKTQVLATRTDYYHLFTQYDWDADIAHKIMMCESSGNPNAVGDTNTKYHSYGLMQIRALPNRPSPEWLKVPENNISYAYKIYLQEGKRFGTTGGWYNCSKKYGIR